MPSKIKCALDINPPLPLVVQYTPPYKGGRAADLGCGEGNNTIFIAEQGYQVDAIDGFISGTMTCDAEDVLTFSQWSRDNPERNVTVHFQEMLRFLSNVPRGSYDLIVATYVLHFFADVTEKELLYQRAMPEIIRVLKTGGRFICSMLKSKQDKEDNNRELIPFPLNNIVSDDELEAIWKNELRRIYYNPARWNDGHVDGSTSNFMYCHWELVADKT